MYTLHCYVHCTVYLNIYSNCSVAQRSQEETYLKKIELLKMYLSNILHIIGECFLNKNMIGGINAPNMLSKHALSNLSFNHFKLL